MLGPSCWCGLSEDKGVRREPWFAEDAFSSRAFPDWAAYSQKNSSAARQPLAWLGSAAPLFLAGISASFLAKHSSCKLNHHNHDLSCFCFVKISLLISKVESHRDKNLPPQSLILQMAHNSQSLIRLKSGAGNSFWNPMWLQRTIFCCFSRYISKELDV